MAACPNPLAGKAVCSSDTSPRQRKSSGNSFHHCCHRNPASRNTVVVCLLGKEKKEPNEVIDLRRMCINFYRISIIVMLLIHFCHSNRVEGGRIDVPRKDWSLTSMLSHLFSILIHFPSRHVKWVDGQALSCSWTLMRASFTSSEGNVIFIDLLV